MSDSNSNKDFNKEVNDSRENLLNDQILLNESELLNDLDNLRKIKFKNNIFGIGTFNTIVEFNNDEAIINTKFNDKVIKSKTIHKKKFLQKLRKIHMEAWRRYYSSSSLEGHIWHLTLYFKNGNIIRTGGNSNYPDNFKKLRKLLKVGKLKFPKIDS